MVSIIPLTIAQRRLDTGNAVQYPQGSPIGDAMRGFGDELSAVAERYQQVKDQQEAFDAELARRRFNGQIAQAEDEATANAPADGAGLHDAMYGQVDPYNGRVVKTGRFDKLFAAALPGMPESQRAAFARQKETMREAGSLRIAARQLQRRRDYEQAEVDTALKTSAIAIGNANPDDHVTFEAARQQGLDLIDKMGLDPGIRQQKVKDWFGTAAKLRFEALIAKDPKRALELFGVGTPASGSDAIGDTAQAAGKGDRVGKQTPDEMLARAFQNDLSPPEQAALTQKAQATNAAQQVELRTNIGLAEQNAPGAIARTGTYSGKVPGRDAFRIAYGLDEGDKRFRDFDLWTDVGRQVFGMRTMPSQAIHAALRDAEPGPNGSPEDQARREATAVAVGLVMNHRRADAGGYVSEVFPNIAAAWKAVIGGGLEDPNGYDKDAYDKAIAMSVAAQEQLGIENPQPVPLSIIRDLSENYDSKSTYQQDENSRVSTLLAGTSGPVARAAVAQQLADADLGWIIPGAGYEAPSTLSVLASYAKGLGKVAANAGIALANVNDWVAYGMSGGTISPPDYKGAYYNPANRVENLAMHQGSDALGWAIPWPGVGRAAVAEEGIARAVEAVGSGAAARTEQSIGNLEAANIPTSKVASRQVEKLGAGEGAKGAIPAKPQPENVSKQPTTSLNAAGEPLVADSNALSGVTTPSLAQGGRQTTRSPRKSKLDRKMIAEVASELFARDPNRVEHPGAKFGEATTNNYRKGYSQANPGVNIEDLVIHHQAEQQLLKRFPNFISEKKINSVENLRGIPKGLNDILHLVILRAENSEFYAKYPNPTEQQLLDHSTMMDKKYGHHFVPPVGKNVGE
ncbi:hypothetical protein ACFSQT_06730 [Mesorhizobium calcicola]|uniref:Uncharacterized protein n=1 Tax=Mesorhizobium calcicola TaxID=1300310 RepID=A0ABW4WBM7_9HYPH